MRPSSNARPTIAPSAPARSSASRSASEPMPPAASTARPERSTTRATKPTSGPSSVPSRSIAVQRTRRTPAPTQRPIASSRSRPLSVQPRRVDDVVAHVQRDDEPLAEGGDELVEEAPRRRADHDSARSRGEQRLGVRNGPDPAGSLSPRRRSGPRHARRRPRDEALPRARRPDRRRGSTARPRQRTARRAQSAPRRR